MPASKTTSKIKVIPNQTGPVIGRSGHEKMPEVHILPSLPTAASNAACAAISARGKPLGNSRLPEAEKLNALELFVYGVPVFRQRFRARRVPRHWSACAVSFAPAAPTWKNAGSSLKEALNAESLFGGHRKGKRGWGAAGKIIFRDHQTERTGQGLPGCIGEPGVKCSSWCAGILFREAFVTLMIGRVTRV